MSGSDFYKVLSAIEGHCGIFQVKEADLTTLQRLIVQYLAKTSCFEEVKTEWSYWHRFTGFGDGKAMVSRGLKSLCRGVVQSGKFSREDQELAVRLLNDLPMNPKWGYHATTLFREICQMIASMLIEKKLMQEIAAPEQTDAAPTHGEFTPPPVEPPSDSVFGSHDSSSLDSIPF